MNDERTTSAADEILALERNALERWSNGDPSGFIEITAAEVTYFDPFVAQRIDDRDALRAYYETLRGKARASSFELSNPRVQLHDPVAILTFNFSCVLATGKELRWNCTEVYLRKMEGWRIVQTHWSFTKS